MSVKEVFELIDFITPNKALSLLRYSTSPTISCVVKAVPTPLTTFELWSADMVPVLFTAMVMVPVLAATVEMVPVSEVPSEAFTVTPGVRVAMLDPLTTVEPSKAMVASALSPDRLTFKAGPL